MVISKSRYQTALEYTLLLLLSFGYFSLFSNALIDDTFITMQYARTLSDSGTWGFYEGFTTNTATSPLNVILLALLSKVFSSPITSILVLASICTLVNYISLKHLARALNIHPYVPLFAITLMVANPLIVSTLGLESLLFATLLISASTLFITHRYNHSALALGALTLSRPDGALLFLVFLFLSPDKKGQLRFLMIFSLSLLPWALFSWFGLGSLVPETLFIKQHQGSWGEWNYINGLLLYLRTYPLALTTSLLSIPLAILTLYNYGKNSRVKLLFTYIGIAHVAGYHFLGVPPYHWYYVPDLIILILLGAMGFGELLERANTLTTRQKKLFTAIAFGVPITLMGASIFRGGDGGGVKEMPIHTNWATHERYKEVGTWIKDQNLHGSIKLSGEIGTIAYYCDCYLLDKFSSRALAIPGNTMHAVTPREKLLKLNFYFYTPPAKDYPPRQYHLLGSRKAPPPSINERAVKAWKTSTQWIPEGYVALLKAE